MTRWIDHRDDRGDIAYVPWYIYYRLTLNANGILSRIDNPDLKGEKAQKDRIKGEALAYRAWTHFQLVQLYAKRYEKGKNNDQLGVVLRDSVGTSEKPRATVEEIYAFINKDLDESISLLKTSSLTNKMRINYVSALGLKARVALVQQNWADAAKFAEEAISVAKTKGIVLQKGNALLSGFNDTEKNSEWIWAYKQTTDQNKYFGHFNAYMSWNFSSSNIRTNPKVINKDLFKTINKTDVRRNWWDEGYEQQAKDKNGKPVFDDKGNPVMKWFPSPDFEKNFPRPNNYLRAAYNNFKFTAQDYGNSSGDILLMRIAEMYYIASEAYAHAGDEAKAQSVLNEIMITRDSNYKKSIKTGTDLLNEILDNRRIDLWGEGFRFTDLKRLNLPLNRFAATNTVENVSRKMEVPAGHKEWQFLIPKKEMDSNKNIKQNEL